MKGERFVWTMLVALLLSVAGTQTASAMPGFYDYDFTLDGSSYLTVTATVDPAIGTFGSQTDTATSSLSGSLSAYLNPLESAYSQIQIYDMNVVADDPVSMSLSWGSMSGWVPTGATANVDGTDLGLLLGGSENYGTAGGVTTVGSGGSFTQTGNLIQATGEMDYSILAKLLGVTLVDMSDSLELIDDSEPQSADLAGTVTSSGDIVTLTLNVDMTIDLKEYLVGEYAEYAQYLDSGTVTIEGSIVAYADVPLLGDVNGDGSVGLADLTALGGGWGTGDEWEDGDLNLDGSVGLADLTILGSQWGATASGDPVQAPEPATMSLLGVGALALLRRRK